jgi:hypothetical protein
MCLDQPLELTLHGERIADPEPRLPETRRRYPLTTPHGPFRKPFFCNTLLCSFLCVLITPFVTMPGGHRVLAKSIFELRFSWSFIDLV